jgi:hypothetical protein
MLCNYFMQRAVISPQLGSTFLFWATRKLVGSRKLSRDGSLNHAW